MSRIRTKLLTHFLLLSLLPICLIGYIAYKAGEKALREKVLNHLITAAILKEQEIKAWVEEKESDIRLMASLPSVKQKAIRLIESRRDDSERARIYTDLQATFQELVPNEPDFVEAFLLELSRGQVVLSTDKQQEGKLKEDRPYFRKGKKKPFTQNIYYSLTTEKPAMTFSAPIKDESGQVVGLLVGRIDLARLDRIMHERTGLGRTGETYLVNKFNFFVSEARGSVGFPARKGNFTDGVKEALRGKNGTALYENYKGVPVIGAHRWLAKQKLALIAEMEQSEAFAPIMALRKVVLGIGVALTLIVALLGVFFARTITGPVHKLVNGAEEIGRGNLEYQIAVGARDEIGELSRAFDEMRKNLKEITVSRDELNIEVTERKRVHEMLARQAKELLEVNAKLQRFNRSAVGREQRMIELKRQVNELLQETGRPPAYDLSFVQGEKEHKRE